MPATSRAQQEMMAIAEHDPGELYGRNRGVLKMSHKQLHDFAATKGLKKGHKGKSKGKKHHFGHTGAAMSKKKGR